MRLSDGQFPPNYIAAREALEQLAEHDEYADVNGETLRTNPDRFNEALASYARQSDDDRLERAAARIRRRAVRELQRYVAGVDALEFMMTRGGESDG